MSKLFNLAKMTTATEGTGAITLDSAVSGFLTFVLAGVADVASWVAGEYLTIDVDQIGSTLPGSDLVVHIISS